MADAGKDRPEEAPRFPTTPHERSGDALDRQVRVLVALRELLQRLADKMPPPSPAKSP